MVLESSLLGVSCMAKNSLFGAFSYRGGGFKSVLKDVGGGKGI